MTDNIVNELFETFQIINRQCRELEHRIYNLYEAEASIKNHINYDKLDISIANIKKNIKTKKVNHNDSYYDLNVL